MQEAAEIRGAGNEDRTGLKAPVSADLLRVEGARAWPEFPTAVTLLHSVRMPGLPT